MASQRAPRYIAWRDDGVVNKIIQDSISEFRAGFAAANGADCSHSLFSGTGSVYGVLTYLQTAACLAGSSGVSPV